MNGYNSDNDYLLFNSATYVYVFYYKNRFINFKKATKDQELVCDIDIIIIKS